MPKEYYRQLSAKMRMARIEAIAAFLVVACPILSIACWKHSALWSVLFGVLFVALALLLWFLNGKKPQKKLVEPWRIHMSSVDDFINQDGFMQVYSSTFVKQDSYNQKQIRLLVQQEDVFRAEAASKRRKAANRKANELLGSKQMASMWDAMKKLRVNLIVCEEENEDLKKWVQNTNCTLLRTEVVVNMALVKKENELLIPVLTSQFDLSTLNRYRIAVKYMQLLLSKEI